MCCPCAMPCPSAMPSVSMCRACVRACVHVCVHVLVRCMLCRAVRVHVVLCRSCVHLLVLCVRPERRRAAGARVRRLRPGGRRPVRFRQRTKRKERHCCLMGHCLCVALPLLDGTLPHCLPTLLFYLSRTCLFTSQCDGQCFTVSPFCRGQHDEHWGRSRHRLPRPSADVRTPPPPLLRPCPSPRNILCRLSTAE